MVTTSLYTRALRRYRDTVGSRIVHNDIRDIFTQRMKYPVSSDVSQEIF
jgi:hypothetical protein